MATITAGWGARDVSLKHLFQNVFIIPTYQRPFSWTEDNARDLITDLHNNFSTDDQSTYFLGTVIVACVRWQ